MKTRINAKQTLCVKHERTVIVRRNAGFYGLSIIFLFPDNFDGVAVRFDPQAVQTVKVTRLVKVSLVPGTLRWPWGTTRPPPKFTRTSAKGVVHGFVGARLVDKVMDHRRILCL